MYLEKVKVKANHLFGKNLKVKVNVKVVFSNTKITFPFILDELVLSQTQVEAGVARNDLRVV